MISLLITYYINYWDYPNVRLKSSEFKLPLSNTDMIIHGELDFHGLKRNVELEILFIKTVEEWTVEGKFRIKLSEFDIKRPQLLMIKIEDYIDVEFSLIGTLEEHK